MIETRLEIPAIDGQTYAFLYRPAESGQWPGVLMLSDIIGVRDAKRSMARQLAAAGYTVLLPHLFHRSGPPPMFDFDPSPSDARTFQRVMELMGPLTPEKLGGDLGAYVEALTGQASCAPGKIGVVGYCISGGLSLLTAALFPEQVGVVASFHGALLHTDAPDSPHRLLPAIKARTYFGHAANDPLMPAESIERLDTALKEWGGEHRSETYPAAHGWTVPDRKAEFDAAQAERAFGALSAELGTLASGSRATRAAP